MPEFTIKSQIFASGKRSSVLSTRSQHCLNSNNRCMISTLHVILFVKLPHFSSTIIDLSNSNLELLQYCFSSLTTHQQVSREFKSAAITLTLQSAELICTCLQLWPTSVDLYVNGTKIEIANRSASNNDLKVQKRSFSRVKLVFCQEKL